MSDCGDVRKHELKKFSERMHGLWKFLPNPPYAALAREVGADGYQLLDTVWAAEAAPYLRTLPALEALRQIWVQQYYRCTAPGLAEVRWRTDGGATACGRAHHLAL